MWKRLFSNREHIWNTVRSVVVGAENGFDYAVQDMALWERDVPAQVITTSLYTIIGAFQGGSVGAVYGVLGPVSIPVTAYVMMKRRKNTLSK
jgi:hypothetical protein